MWNGLVPLGLVRFGCRRVLLRVGYTTLVLAAMAYMSFLHSGSPRTVMGQGESSSTSTAPTLIAEQVSTTSVVEIPDSKLRTALEAEFGKSEGEAITAGDMASLTTFTATGTSILSIRGLEHATNLTELKLEENSIWDLSPLAGLDKLELLQLGENIIVSVEPLRGLASLKELHLGRNAISDVEPLLDLRNLEILHLWSNNLDDDDLEVLARLTGLTQLLLSGESITDLGQLAQLINLETLHVTHSSVSDVSPLAGLSRLTELAMNWGSVSDITPLAHLSNLETLELWHNDIEDFSPLDLLKGLTKLDISDNKLTDEKLSVVEGLTNLEWLDVGKYYADPDKYVLTDISPLANLANLKQLHVEGHEISDLSPLSGLTGLTELHFYRNNIVDLSPIAGLVNLEEIALGENPISDLTPFANTDLGKLERLYMWNCEIEDLSPLSGLTSLKLLHLYGNEVVDVSPLTGLTGLDELHLGDNSISDLSQIAGLEGLSHLHLFLNEIEDLSPLSGLSNLNRVHLYGNRIADLSPLAGLTGLEDLHLGLNLISDVSPLSGLENLDLLHLYGNDIVDVSPLLANEGLDRGDSLDISGNPLSGESLDTHISELRSRGVRVEYVPAPNAPSEVATRVWGTDTVEISWIADVSTTTADTTGYRVESSPNVDGEWTELIDDTESTGTTFYDTGLSAADTRYYRVSALSRVGDSFPSEAAVTTTRQSEVEARVASDARTTVHVGRTALTFGAGSRENDFQVRASADVARCGVEGEDGSAPGTVLECLRVEIPGGDDSPARPARLQRPMGIAIVLSPVLIDESGGLAELFRHYLNGDLKLLSRRAAGEQWTEISLGFSVDSARPTTAYARISRLGDFVLVHPGSATP